MADNHKSIFDAKNSYFIVGHYSSGMIEGLERQNDPQFDNGRYTRAFLGAETGASQKEKLEKRVAEIVHRDNPFYDAKDLEDALKARVYVLDKAPALLQFPEQRDEAVTAIAGKNANAAYELKKSLMGQFLGNSYSMDWQYMVGVGERLSARALQEAFPEAYAALTGKGGPVFTYSTAENARMPYVNTRVRDGQMMIERTRQQEAIDIFARNVPDSALPKVAALLDRHSQWWSADFTKTNWSDAPAGNDGISYTNHVEGLDGSVQQAWQSVDIERGFAEKNARFVGTVADLLKSGDLQWPAEQEMTLAGRFKKALGLVFSKDARAEEAKQAAFNASIAAIRNKVFQPS